MVLLIIDADRNGVFPNTVIPVPQGIPVGGFGLPAAVAVGCPRHPGLGAVLLLPYVIRWMMRIS